MIFRHLLNMRSHPTWVRGLKHQNLCELACCNSVAPYLGAWIETKMFASSDLVPDVAPYVGAWIETTSLLSTLYTSFVAPYMGA